MRQHQPCARSCLREAFRAGTGWDVPNPVALVLGTSCCQQRAGEGGMLCFSSRLPAGKNSPGFLCILCIYSVSSSVTLSLLALTCVSGRKYHLPPVRLCASFTPPRPRHFPQALYNSSPSSGTYVTASPCTGHWV